MPHEGAQNTDLTGQPIGGVDRSKNPPEFHVLSVDSTGALNVVGGGGGGSDVNLVGINGTAPAVTNPLFVELSDGTNPLGTVGNPVFTEPSGVGVQPTEDAADATIGSAPPSVAIMIGVKDGSGNAQDLSAIATGATVKAAAVAIVDASGAQITSFGSSASVGATGSSVPASANYEGINVAGTLRGQTGVNPSGSVFAEQVDVASIAGTTADTNSGNKSAGTLRVVLATDQPQLTNALKVDGSGSTQPVSGTVTAEIVGHAGATLDGTAGAPSTGVLTIQGVGSGTAVPISGSVSITGNPAVVGTKSSNAGVPGATNLGVLPAIANAAAPTYTEGDQVLLSVDLTGAQRTFQSELPLDVLATGNITANAQNVAIAANGVDGIIFNVTGTWVATLQPQFQLPDSSWVNGSVFPTLPSGVSQSTVTANGQFKTFGGGFKGFRILSTAYTSGTAVISIEGSQRSTVTQVLIKGGNGGAVDGTTAVAVPTNAIAIGTRAATAYPTAVTDGQLVNAMADKAGRAVVVANTVRDLVGTALLNSSSSSLVSFIASGGAGVFTDIITFVATNESTTPTIVTLSDGTNSYKFALAPNGGIVMNYPTPLPAPSSATAWQVSNSAAVAVDFFAIYAKNK